MDNDPGTIKKIHEGEEREKIKKLQKKIDITKYNVGVFSEILSETPSDTQREGLIEENRRHQHGVAGLEKGVRDIGEVLEEQEQRERSHVGASAFLQLFVIARLVSVGRLFFMVAPLSVIGTLSHCLAAFRFLLTDFFGVDLTVFRHDITSSIGFAVDSALFRVENKY